MANAAGCDSVVTLNLTITTATGIDTHTACDTFTWIDGNTYTSSDTTATHTLANAAGCDSVVTLNLTILNSTTATDTQTACDSISINGQKYDSSGIYTQTLTNSAGCDSILTLNLNIIEDPSFTVNQQVLSSPPYNAQFTNTTPNLSNYNFTWNFGDGSIIQDNNAIVSHTYIANGLYDVSLMAEELSTGCLDTILKVEYIYCNGPSSIDETSSNISLHPNPTNDLITLNIEDYNGSVDIDIYDLSGKLLHNTNATTISLKNYAKGIYVFRVSYGDIVEELRVLRD